MKPSDIRVRDVETHLIPIEMRMPLKFGGESIDSVTCLRVRVEVEDRRGRRAVGWGETPLSVTWAWPSNTLTYQDSYDQM
ncbi:MAG: hypothetical protein AAF664_17780, partial [Planctomycetota bacterium]